MSDPSDSPPPSPAGLTTRGHVGVWLTLLGLLALAAALRFTGLGWGLRHTPDYDESIFVESTRAMLRAGDLDHRFYEYPGLFIYLLAPLLAFFPAPTQGGLDPAAYLAARVFVAAFSVANVALAYRLAARLAGVPAGLTAAALLAASPLEIWTAHTLRPDVVLTTFVLLSLQRFAGTGAARRNDLCSGLWIGATAAVKFTGGLIAPVFVLTRLTRPGPKWRGLVLAGLVAALVWATLTPYALLRPSAFLAGLATQRGYFYQEGRGPAPLFLELLTFYGRAVVSGVGLPGAALAVAALVVWRRRWREWLPLVAYPILLVTLLSTAEARFSRLSLSAVAPVTVLAGLGLAALYERWRRLAQIAGVVAFGLSLTRAIPATAHFTRSTTLDRALDWIEAQAPPGARVLTDVQRLGIDQTRFDVVVARRLRPVDRPWAEGMDVTVIINGAPAGWSETLITREDIVPEVRFEGTRLAVLTPRLAGWRRVPLAASALRASQGGARLGALVDGDPSTTWSTDGSQQAGTWLEVELPQPAVVQRIELRLAGPKSHAGALEVLVRDDGGPWRPTPVFLGRPAAAQQASAAGPESQAFLLAPTRTRGLRLVLTKGRRQPWVIAELELSARVTP